MKIKIQLKIDNEDVNKDVYFLDNTKDKYYLDSNHYVFRCHDNLKELNESNVELYINDIQFKYKKYFRPEKEGIYNINLKFNVNITDCSYMF
jgi:hypothetical protein